VTGAHEGLLTLCELDQLGLVLEQACHRTATVPSCDQWVMLERDSLYFELSDLRTEVRRVRTRAGVAASI
jgi:hypothetical protein